MTDQDNLRPALRALAAVLEPIVGSVYFAKEAHEAYVALGHGPTPGQASDEWGKKHWGKVLQADYHAYFCNRGALLGQVPGEVIAAAFGVFNPAIVLPAALDGYKIADAAAMRSARDEGAIAQLKRILGDRPDGLDRVNDLLLRGGERLKLVGKPLYAGVVALGIPDEPMLRMWRLAERLREYRGDAFIAAYTTSGFDGCEMQVLSERLAGEPPRAYAATRGWSEQDLDVAEESLTRRGYLENGHASPAGADAREEVEQITDRMCAPIEEALGDDLRELVRRLQPWGDLIRANHGYYPTAPQEEVVHPAVQDWLEAEGLHRLGEFPAGV